MLKKFTISILALGFLSILYINLTAFSDGIVGWTKRGNTSDQGCICHYKTATDSVSVRINGPASVRAGDTTTFTLKIARGHLVRGGCDISASLGQVIISPLDTTLKRVETGLGNFELTHRAPKAPVQDTVRFTFRYIAPNTPNVFDTIFANGNSVNYDGSYSDDNWNFAPNKLVSVTTSGVNDPSSVVKNFSLDQNFPNPFNPNTKISFTLDKAAIVTLKVFDVNGKEVSSLIDNKNYSTGSYTMNFDAARFNLNSGVYFYKLEANGFSEVKKMMLVK
jgi:hypothetical protein